MKITRKFYGTVDRFVNSSFYIWWLVFFIGMGFCNVRNDFKEEKRWKKWLWEEFGFLYFCYKQSSKPCSDTMKKQVFRFSSKTLYIECIYRCRGYIFSKIKYTYYGRKCGVAVRCRSCLWQVRIMFLTTSFNVVLFDILNSTKGYKEGVSWNNSLVVSWTFKELVKSCFIVSQWM